MQALDRTVLSLALCLAAATAVSDASAQSVPGRAALAQQATTEPLDVDASGTSDALTDGLLVIRYLFGLRNTPLVQGAVAPSAQRSTTDIQNYLAGQTTGAPPAFDIDGNGSADALTDGLLILRYLFGVRGAPLIQGAVGSGASRQTSGDIEGYLATLTSSTPQPPSGCTIVQQPATSAGSPVVPGTSVQLTAHCTGGQQPITYTWDSGAFTGAVRTVSPAVITAYTMIASNAAGPASQVSSTVYVAAPLSYCQGNDQTVDVPWPAGGQTRPGTTAFTTQVYTFRLHIPTTFNPPHDITQTGFVHTAEIAGYPNTFRQLTVSKSACDFHAPHGGYLLDTLADLPNPGPGFSFTVGNPNGYQQ